MKEIWHKIEDGEFEKKGKKYNYVIEQNKNNPLMDGKPNVRMRIVKEIPKIDTVRTRYDPEIYSYGSKGGYIPVSIGYSLKSLKRMIRFSYIFITIFTFIIISIFSIVVFNFDIINYLSIRISNYIPSVNIHVNGVITRTILLIIIAGFLLYFLIFPQIAKYIIVKDKIKMLKLRGVNHPSLIGRGLNREV